MGTVGAVREAAPIGPRADALRAVPLGEAVWAGEDGARAEENASLGG